MFIGLAASVLMTATCYFLIRQPHGPTQLTIAHGIDSAGLLQTTYLLFNAEAPSERVAEVENPATGRLRAAGLTVAWDGAVRRRIGSDAHGDV